MTSSVALPSSSRLWLLMMLLGVCAPHFSVIPSWLMLLTAGVLLWSTVSALGKVAGIPRWLKWGLVIGVIIGVFLSATRAKGLEGLSTLLVAGAVLKLFELNTRRDGWVLVLVACFIAAVGFLFNQSLLAAVYGMLSLWVIFSALIAMHQTDKLGNDLKPLQKSGIMLLQSTPLMLVLFFLFPRLGPLWNVQYKNNVAQTGLSEMMEPGRVSELARSEKVAFRASFEGNRPPTLEERYWRVMTYSDFDGSRWLVDEEPASNDTLSVTKPSTQINYQVIAEPSAREWLFTLDYPQSIKISAVKQADGTFRALSPLMERLSYSATSVLQREPEVLTASQRNKYLALPSQGNPRTRELVSSWLQQGLTQISIVDRLFELFRQDFSYTLSPGTLSGERIDQFLFESQQGFCEHFAESSVYILRLAGVPARLVGGYLGGEWNPFENYLQVRQYEAHAWAEAWFPDQGWVRLDPTAAVAPERILQPFGELFGNEPEFASETAFSLINLESNVQWIGQLRLRYEALNYQWHRWVLGYHHQQNNLIQDWLGGISIIKMLMVLSSVALMLGAVIWWLLRTPRVALHVLDQDIEALSRRLGRLDEPLQRQTGESVMHYAQRLSQSFPETQSLFLRWANAFQAQRYAPGRYPPTEYRLLYSQLVREIKRKKHRTKL